MKVSAAVVIGLLAVPAAAPAQSVTDPQIAAIVVVANQVDIDAGKVAAARGSHAEVKAFGEQMVAAHTGVNKSAGELVARLKMQPEGNATSQALRSAGEKNVAKLQGLRGAEFDRAYLENEILYHQQVLDAVDKTLIPSARNEELKALLVKVRPAFVAHLEHAKQLQATLAKGR